MSERQYEIKSLCIAINYNLDMYTSRQQTKICRIADLSADELIIDDFSQHYEDNDYVIEDVYTIFPQRQYLLDKYTISELDTAAIWEWTVRDNNEAPEKGSITGVTLLQNQVPIEIYKLPDCSDKQDVIEALKKGIPVLRHICKKILFTWQEDGMAYGFLCEVPKEVEIIDKKFYLSNDTNFLFMIKGFENDILYITKFDRAFYRYTSIEGLEGASVFLKDKQTVVKECVLSCLTKKLGKDISFNRKDWQNARTLLDSILNTNINEKISIQLRCSVKEAEDNLMEFLDNADQYFNSLDFSDLLITNLFNKNKDIHDRCVNLGRAEWEKDNHLTVKQASEKVNEFLQNGNSQLKSLNLKIQDLQNQNKNLLNQISENQKRLNESNNQLKEKEKQALYYPQKNHESSALVEVETNELLYKPGKAYSSNDDVESIMEYEDAEELLEENLYFISNKFKKHVASLILAAYQRNRAILLAGPYGDKIADALSTTLFAETAGKIKCDGKYDCYIWDKIEEKPEKIIVLQNILKPGWIDELPDFLNNTNKYCICTCPIKENLLLEPEGFFDYIIPLFTEDWFESIDFSYGWLYGRQEIEKLSSEVETAYGHVIPIKLKMHTFARNRLSEVLSLAQSNGLSVYGKYLIALYPYAYVTNRLSDLQEIIESDTQFSPTDCRELIQLWGIDE